MFAKLRCTFSAYLDSPACQNMVEAVDEFTSHHYTSTAETKATNVVRETTTRSLTGTSSSGTPKESSELSWRTSLDSSIYHHRSDPLKLKDVKVLFKTYKETRSWFHILVNFRIWVIDITAFWFYSAKNSPTILVVSWISCAACILFFCLLCILLPILLPGLVLTVALLPAL